MVYCKPPFAGPEQVLGYLGRYTHRVAITNERICAIEEHEGTVAFSYKDYADGGCLKRLTLKADEFIRRFLLHVLPRGFVKIRHYGLLANNNRKAKIAIASRLLGAHPRFPLESPLNLMLSRRTAITCQQPYRPISSGVTASLTMHRRSSRPWPFSQPELS